MKGAGERSCLLFWSQLCYEDGNMHNLHLTIFAIMLAHNEIMLHNETLLHKYVC